MRDHSWTQGEANCLHDLWIIPPFYNTIFLGQVDPDHLRNYFTILKKQTIDSIYL